MIINELRPYVDYRKTGFDWLNSVPRHWQETTIRGVTELSNMRNGKRTDLELLSVYREYGVIRKKSRDDNHNVESLDLSNYKYVNKGYLVLNKMKMWQGSLGISKYEGIVSPAYIVCKTHGDLNLDYLHMLLRSPQYKTVYNRISYGVRVGQWDMRYEDFKSIKMYIPPRPEQDQIVKYLDHQLFKINKFVKAKKKLIAVLKEQKQAIINEAVTKGLDPNVKMKSSGVEWLGDVPEHWEVQPLKRLLKQRMSDGPHVTPEFIDFGVPFVSAEAVRDGRINLNNKRGYISQKDHEKFCLKVKPQRNDIFIVKSGSTTGKSCIVDFDEEFSIWSPLALVRINKFHDSEFIFHITNSTYYQKQVENKWSFGTQPNIGMGVLQNILFAFPQKNEQVLIVESIRKSTSKILRTIRSIENELDLIIEYKNSLISDVVTGKIDVRYMLVNETEEIDLEELGHDEDSTDLEEILEDEEGDE